MSSPRLLVGAAALALASAALPATAMASLVRDTQAYPAPFPQPDTSAQYGSNNLQYTGADGSALVAPTADGILAPGENVNVNFPLIDTSSVDGTTPYDGTARGQLFETGSSFLSFSDPAGGSSPTLRTWGPDGTGGYQNGSPYNITVSPNLTCGTNVPLHVQFPSLGSTDLKYGLPTGAPASYHTTQSYDIGQIEPDGGTANSKVTIADSGLLKGLRIHIDSIEHQISTHWLKIKLVAPDGTTAVLFSQVGAVPNSGVPVNKHLVNVTFSSDPVNGQAPVSAEEAAASDFTNQVIKPVDNFSVFDGKSLAGDWHLVVSDVAVAGEPRSGVGTRSASLGRSAADLVGSQNMFQLGGWQLTEAGATCSAQPQAWLDNPTFVDPDGTSSLDASGSFSPVPGRTIVSYQWDLNAPATGSPTFTAPSSSPTIAFPASAAGTRLVALKVTDSANATSSIFLRSVIITKKPVLDVNTTPAPAAGTSNLIGFSPAKPQAGDTVTLAAHATDPEGGSLIYAWDLNDDGDFSDKSGPTITNVWTTSGPHIVRVLVTDPAGASTLYYQTITIANLPPVAKLSYSPTVPVVGVPMTFDASASSDPDGTIAEYDWDLDGSGQFQTKTTTPTLPFTWTQAGNQTVRLRVVDNTGEVDETLVDFHVTGAPVGVATATPTSPLTGETVTFSASGSHDSDSGGSIAKYEWDLDGNGSWDVTGPTATTATRSYPNAGAVSVRLRVTDNDGATTLTVLNLVVRNPATGGGLGGSGGSGGGTTTPGTGGTTTPGTGGTTTPGTGTTAPLAVSPATQALFPTLPSEVQAGTGTLADAVKGVTPSSGAVSPKGFVATIATGAKQHGSKTYKKGIAVNYKANTAGTLTVNLMVLPKDAKTVGLKLKGTKLVKIGAGKATATKSGTYKFVVKVAKKYQRYVKKAKKLPVELRAVATSKDTGETLVIGKKFTYVK